MPGNGYLPDVTFPPAPIGSRVRWMSLGIAVVMVVLGAVAAALVPGRGPLHGWGRLLAPVVSLPALALYFHGARIRRYRLSGGELIVERPWLTRRFPVAGLQAVVRDAGALRGARKIIGNEGLGAVSGRFRSRRLGRFSAYVSDPERAVVLRWADRCLVVSPVHPDWFIETLRKRADLTFPS